jgi:ABC-type proline/glycine betaine transport system ATPase subunit
MVMIEGLFTEVVTIFIYDPFNSLDPVTKNLFQFGFLNLVRKRLNAIKMVR